MIQTDKNYNGHCPACGEDLILEDGKLLCVTHYHFVIQQSIFESAWDEYYKTMTLVDLKDYHAGLGAIEKLMTTLLSNNIAAHKPTDEELESGKWLT